MNIQHHVSDKAVINCYLREEPTTWQYYPAHKWQRLFTNTRMPSVALSHSLIHITLVKQNIHIAIGVTYWSATQRHQFSFPIYCSNGSNQHWYTITLGQFIVYTMQEYLSTHDKKHPQLDTLLYRSLDSAKNIQTFLDHRKNAIDDLHSHQKQSFIQSEQALLIGHQLHPTGKSRSGFSHSEMLQYSPETAEQFQLVYFAVQKKYLHEDSATGTPTHAIIKQSLSKYLAHQPKSILHAYIANDDMALIPVHPWQATFLRSKSHVKALEEQGAITHLGAYGPYFKATTSIRTVFSEDDNFMYKLSLNLRITNSERVNKHWELDRVVETARMLRHPIAQEIKKSAPDFYIIDEPAYISVKVGNKVLDGFSCILRDATHLKGHDKDITSITSLIQDHPFDKKSRLYNIIYQLAQNEGTSLHDTSLKWFQRYLDVTITSLMRLFVDWGLCFEPHGQNMLIELENGYPTKGFCRDGQGFFHREASHEDWCKIFPHKGEKTQSIFPEELAKERLIYYPFINQLFSVINAFGTQGLIQEKNLLEHTMQTLNAIGKEPTQYPFTLLSVLQQAEHLPCKGNLLTQLYDMDELVGDIAEQSVYIHVNNCLKQASDQHGAHKTTTTSNMFTEPADV